MVPPQQPHPQPKPQSLAKKGFSLELPTGSSSASSSKNPLTSLASGGGGTSLSLATGSSTFGGTQPSLSTFVETAPIVLSDSESDWDERDADGPSPLNPQSQPRAEPQPYRFGSPTIEEDPPAGFNGMSDIVDGDEGRYDEDENAEGDGEGVGIDTDGLMAEMDEHLQGGGEGDSDDPNEVGDFLAGADSPDSEPDQEGYQSDDVGTDVGGEMSGDDDYPSPSDYSDD